MNIDQQIAWRLRARRQLLGLTLQEVADGCGVSAERIRDYEDGCSRVSAVCLWRLARALDVEPDYFFGSPPSRRPAHVTAFGQAPAGSPRTWL